MSSRLCPTCTAPMELERLGRLPDRIEVAFCAKCNLVLDEPAPRPVAPDYPRSSDDRSEP